MVGAVWESKALEGAAACSALTCPGVIGSRNSGGSYLSSLASPTTSPKEKKKQPRSQFFLFRNSHRLHVH